MEILVIGDCEIRSRRNGYGMITLDLCVGHAFCSAHKILRPVYDLMSYTSEAFETRNEAESR